MARRIRWQMLIAAISSLIVLGLMASLALNTRTVSRPIEGGVYVEAVSPLPLQLNPLLSDPARDPTGADLQRLLFDGLVQHGTDGLPVPALAASLPEISPSGNVYTFTLRSNVQWHDGQPLTSDDVIFTFRAVQSSLFQGDRLAAALWRNVLFDRIDERRVRARLPEPFAPLLSLATFPILPAHLLADLPPEQWPTAPFNQQPVGTGPYQIEELTAERALLRANPNYYGGRPFLNNIELRFYGSPREALSAVARNEAMGTGLISVGDLRQTPLPPTMVRYQVPIDAYTQISFNLRRAPLNDQDLRRALATGLDRNALIQQVFEGQAQAIDTPILPGWAATATNPAWYAFDRQRAAEQLTALGYQLGADGVRALNGVPLVLSLLTDTAPDRVAAAQEIARQWGELGVRVEVEQVDEATVRERLERRDFAVVLHGWQRLGSDPDVYELWHSSQSESGANYAGLRDTQIDQALEAARATGDINERLNAYNQFQQIWIDAVPGIMLYQPLYNYFSVADLGGLDFDPANDAVNVQLFGREDRFRSINRWFLRSSREIRGDLRQEP
jgi:peptide/nickel transport system substrate-binding protein